MNSKGVNLKPLNFNSAKKEHKWFFAKKTNEPHAICGFLFEKNTFNEETLSEVAIGQTIGTWNETYISEELLLQKCAKFVSVEEQNEKILAKIAFPISLWHGNLNWLLTLLFGKMSFYPNLQLECLDFESECFGQKYGLNLPVWDFNKTQNALGVNLNKKEPLLMGILKPNVAMNKEQIATLVCEAGEAGCHIVKDDEIRFDTSFKESLSRVEEVANQKSKHNFKLWYVAHVAGNPNSTELSKQQLDDLKNAGADALLWNVWTNSLASLQHLRSKTQLPIFAHPAFAGSFGLDSLHQRICPSVSLGSLLTAAGADFTLFPSPYGKVCLPIATAKKIRMAQQALPKQSILVPSAGINPSHVPLAKKDFGNSFVLNAGTAIFASGMSIRKSVQLFKEAISNAYHE
jgi:2,3-diketo-5-methylthiopentyl-1-phosphate enolase